MVGSHGRSERKEDAIMSSTKPAFVFDCKICSLRAFVYLCNPLCCMEDEIIPKTRRWIKQFMLIESETIVCCFSEEPCSFENDSPHPHGTISSNCSHSFKPTHSFHCTDISLYQLVLCPTSRWHKVSRDWLPTHLALFVIIISKNPLRVKATLQQPRFVPC